MEIRASLPEYALDDSLQFKQDATYLSIQNMVGSANGMWIKFATGYSKDSYNLICDYTFTDNKKGTSHTVKLDIVAKKGQDIFIPFIEFVDFPWVVVDGVARRSKINKFKVVEGYLTSFSLVCYTYLTITEVGYARLAPQQIGKFVEIGPLFLTYYKNNVA